MNGQGTTTWPDGKKYIGNYLNDKKHGYGEFYWANGKNYKGNWDMGK